jgi:hypothetical protein
LRFVNADARLGTVLQRSRRSTVTFVQERKSKVQVLDFGCNGRSGCDRCLGAGSQSGVHGRERRISCGMRRRSCCGRRWQRRDCNEAQGLSPGPHRNRERNDGVFPLLTVSQAIDGHAVIRGYGTPIPVFGDRYRAKAGTAVLGPQAPARDRSLEPALCLQSIQK